MMTKLTKSQDYEILVEECENLLSETKFDISMRNIEWRHGLGKTILESDFYKKHGKGSFIPVLSKDIGLSQSGIYECMKFVEVYPELSTVVGSLNPEKKTLKWSDVRLKLVESPKNCKHDTEEEVLIITRQRCKLCGKVTSEKKEKR